MARNHIYSHLPDTGYFYERCQILGMPWASPVGTPLENLGDYENLDLAFEVTEMTTDRSDTLLSVTAREDVVKVVGTLTGALKQQTAFLSRISTFSTERVYTQVAAVDKDFPVLGIRVGAIYETKLRGLTEATIEIAPDVILTVEDKNLNLDAPTGRVEVISLPEGVEAGVAGTLVVSAPALAEAAKRKEWSLMSGRGEFWRIIVRQLHEGGRDFIIPKIKLRMDGTLALGKSATEFSSVGITGKIIGDVTEDEGREYGYLADY